MTVLEKDAASGVDTDSIEIVETVVTHGSGFRAYPLAGLAAVVICVGAVVGANRAGIDGDRQAEPDQIAEIRAQQIAEDLESRYSARLAKIHEPRAEGMVEFYARQHQARIDWVNGQRDAGHGHLQA